MQIEHAKYQLCRMVLVNAGTNMHVPSGRITAIDPRGGAAVLGDNGVGKTTTLRILPLFFGHLPSQIVAAGHGQEALVRFVLPTDASAIAFEYQRGGESELRLAVIRRRADDPDVPFYRMYRCGLLKELFVSDGRFLSDEETQARATELGIATTSKLTTSEYRSVILRTSATSRDKERLRRYSVDWSFGPKQLDNLDRVVAAMVKKHINFSDIVQVAVGLVQHDLGQGAERAKLSFKQGREPIERWLRNRQACLDAFKLTSEVVALEDELGEHRQTEARYRACRADVAAVLQARKREAMELASHFESLAAERQAHVQAELQKKAELEQAASRTSGEARSAKLEYEDAAAMAANFESERAAHWEQQVQELPALRSRLQSLRDQVAAAEARHADVKTKYAELEHDARTRAGDQSLELERSKEPYRQRLADATSRIAAAEAEALKRCEDEAAERRQQVEDNKEPLLEQRGTWDNLKRNPAASAEALAELEAANQRLQEHTASVLQVQQVNKRALLDERDARQAFHTQEAEVTTARGALGAAQAALAEARLRLSPLEGTLLAALRASPTEDWKRNLARVIDPALLGRDDLDPAVVDEDGSTFYGWRLNTGALAAPDWSDDAMARQSLEGAEQRRALAETHLQAQNDALASRSRKLEDAELTVQTSQARVSVLEGQTKELQNQLDVARQRVANERRNAAGKADAELAKVNATLEALKQQRRTLENELASARAAVKASHDQQRAEAKRLHDDALAAIDTSIATVGRELDKTLRSLAAQLAEHLSKEGVDVNRLNALKSDADALRADIEAREERVPLVKRWKKWLLEGGTTRVESLRARTKHLVDASQAAAARHAEHLQAIQKAEAQHRAVVDRYESRKAQVEEDIQTLEETDGSFEDYLASGESVIDLKTPASALKARARALRSDIERLEGSIGKRSSLLRQSLTARTSAVKELVEASLGQKEEGDVIARASAMCTCYKQIGPQVASDVNLTLKTLLANIGAFQKAIQAFEREVGTFNRRLQAGLSEVKCFERVTDLRLDIVTNFEGLGFYKKLSGMEEVVRRHSSELGKDLTRELPPDETARALADFASVLGADGNVEVNLSSHITLKGSVSDNGLRKEFKRASELENISSEGLTSLVLITLMTALLNTIRGAEPVHVPWVTDEVGKFDPTNFRALMQRLRDNRIDVVTASPELGPSQQALFAHRYLFEDRGRIREYRPPATTSARGPAAAPAEVTP